MSAVSKDAVNHSVVLKHDPALSQIFFSSSVCTVYQFNLSSFQWDKLGIQGTFFLYSRVAQDQSPYALLVLNRNNNTDFSLGITPLHLNTSQPPMEVKFEDSLLMVQVSPTEIYGLWLFDEADREKCLGLIQWCLSNGSN